MPYRKEVRIQGPISQKNVELLSVETLIAILDNVYKGVVVVDTEGKIIFLSRSNEKFYGLKPGEALGKHVTEIIKNSRLHIVARTGKPEIGRIMKVKDDVYRIAERIPIKRDGKVIGAIGKIMFHDIEKAKVLTEHIEQLEKELTDFREQMKDLFAAKYKFNDIIGTSSEIQHVKKMAGQAARTSSTILIEGESGTGKELFAHAIHNASPRRKFPFISVNCASIPSELFESELFGYEAGAFTGALKRGKKGQFQLAHHGTIYLDEISEIPIHMQAKLLRVLQDKEVVSVGSDKPVYVDYRLITSTNRNLKEMMRLGRFREDLFYRLNVVKLKLPPLRNRNRDLEELTHHFIRKLNYKLGTKVAEVSAGAWEVLYRHRWKGNIRELRNVIERGLLVCQEDRELRADHLACYFDSEEPKDSVMPVTAGSLKSAVALAEKAVIEQVLRSSEWNKKQAARLLGISRSSLYGKMKEYGILDSQPSSE